MLSSATIPSSPAPAACSAACAADAPYCGCFKVKVAGDPEADIERLRAIAAARPDADLWLDANQSYSATTLSLTDLITGRIQLVIDNLTSFLPVIKDGRVRALGISTAARSPLIPELPAISEAGVPGYEASSWIMVAAPAGTPPAVTDALAAAMKRITDAPDFRARIAELGAEPAVGTPAQARAFIKQEAAKWQSVITKTGARLE